MKFIERFFPKKQVSEDIETLIGRHLLTLPRCTKSVAIINSSYGAKEYSCEVIVTANDLLPWAEHHSSTVWSACNKDQAARKTLPLWLRTADATQDKVSRLAPPLYRIVEPYTLDFIEKGIAKVFCYECEKQVPYVNTHVHDRKVLGDWVSWVSEWKCDNEHLLYHEHHEAHFHGLCASSGNRST